MSKLINLLMVEDNLQLLNEMYQLVDASEQSYNFFEANSAQSALALLDLHQMDIIIINIDLHDQSGMELARQIRAVSGYEFTWIIFLSARQDYESEAFRKIRCYDYFLKPYDAEAVFGTVELLSHYRTCQVREEEARKYVCFKQRDQLFRILASDILYIEVIGNNSTIHTYSQVFCLRKMSLKRLKLLLPNYFVQCHKSFIVNRNYIEAIHKGPFGWEIRLKNYARSVPNGDKYKDNLTALAQLG